jgi:hypothetical protein
MSDRDLFTTVEWETVGRAPFMAGAYIVTADLSDAIGVVRELLTVEELVAKEAAKPHGLPIAKDISADVEAGWLSTDVGALSDQPDARTHALEQVVKAVRLVAANAPSVAPDYRDWLTRIAHGVAEATREGHVLGFARRVSETEKTALAELENALASVT